MPKRKAMTTEHARRVRVARHKLKDVFADLIQGAVNRGT